MEYITVHRDNTLIDVTIHSTEPAGEKDRTISLTLEQATELIEDLKSAFT
jgi:hypothetical protein